MQERRNPSELEEPFHDSLDHTLFDNSTWKMTDGYVFVIIDDLHLDLKSSKLLQLQ